ncbi:MAG: hypothetical protein E7509_02210 [Ruminococcus sp.]|nr:hypothetical protein [Ruminococcus sp.]
MKKRILSIAVCGCLLLTGCGVGNTLGIEGLMASPNLTDEQSNIHETLEKSVGKDISLKYPKNGNNRSAYIVADIDTEITDEALVFYELKNTSVGDSGVRINVMDQTEGGHWKSVFDLAGKGTDIDKVSISALGADKLKNIIVGYSSMTVDVKYLQISRYDENGFMPSVFEDTYSLMEILDLDKDGQKEIFAVMNNATTSTVTASLIQSEGGLISKTHQVAMASDTVSFPNSTIGLADEHTPAVFVDCLKSTGELQTEIIYFRYNKLQNPLLQMPEKLLMKTSRPAGYYSRDIDGNGIIEIPVTELMPGHESLPDEEKVLMTSWYNYNDYYSLEKKYSGYYSISDGYQMVFPKRWQGVVTTKIDTATNEAVFYKYEGNISGFMTELMRIKVCPKTMTSDFEYQGYEVIGSSGQLDYLVKIPTNRREPLIPTIDEVKNSFYIIQ